MGEVIRADEAFRRDVVRRVPRMRSLLGAEFNLDWRLDWPDLESVLVQDLDRAPRQDNAALRDELDLLLSVLLTDASVDELLAFLDSGLDPVVDAGRPARSWLVDLRDRAARNATGASGG